MRTQKNPQKSARFFIIFIKNALIFLDVRLRHVHAHEKNARAYVYTSGRILLPSTSEKKRVNG